MSTHKTFIPTAVITSFLNYTFPKGISNLEVIKGGQGSQAFSFSVLDDQYVIRINKNGDKGFKKDKYAFTHFAPFGIPIPEIYKIGKINDDLDFCISKKSPGETLDTYTAQEQGALGPELFATLDAIHAVDISATEGYGEWDSDGHASSRSWNNLLLTPDDRLIGTPGNLGLFETSFLEKDFLTKVHNTIAGLVQFCPEGRYLLHADYGFDNVLSDGKKITGVIDWENSMYGDYLYDLAWLSFWSSQIGYESMYLESAKKKGAQIEHFNERLLCYKLHIGLGATTFFAYSNQKNTYESTKKIVEQLLTNFDILSNNESFY